MTKISRETNETAVDALDVPLDTLSVIVLKARAFDAQTEVSNPGEASGAIDDNAVEVREGRADDSTAAALRAAIRRLSLDEQNALVAFAWFGDFYAAEWEDAKQMARERRSASTWLPKKAQADITAARASENSRRIHIWPNPHKDVACVRLARTSCFAAPLQGRV